MGALPTVSSVPFEPLFLAIDQGGHSSRALVFDRAGRLHASGVVQVPTTRPRPGWVEQDPATVLESVTESLGAVAETLGERVHHIQAAGLATQRSSIVCWDRGSGEPLSPVISWQDRRGEARVRRLRKHAQRVAEVTGLVLSSHYGGSKIRWCLEQLPAVQNALEDGRLAIGPLASYLLFHLCDERPFVVDPAIAARTQLFDIESLDWSAELLDLFGVARAVLPTCVPSRHAFGRLELRGSSVPLAISTGDQSSALFADGMPDSDTAFVNLGTGAFVQRIANTHQASGTRLLHSVVWHDSETTLYASEGSINGCGSAVEKVGSEVGIDGDSVHAHADEWLSRLEPPPLFLNGVSGLGSPYWVAEYPTQMVGSGEPWQRMVAVFESILFLVQVNLEEMDRELGPPRRIHLAGGLAASSALCQRMADLSGIESVRSEAREATARGLAYFLAASFKRGPFKTSVERFVPRTDPQLEARFWRWREELEARLPKDS